MIRPLRQRHRRLITVLALVLPALALAALAARGPALTPSLEHGEPAPAGQEWRGLAGGGEVAARVAGPPGALRLEISGRADAPDLLVYWAPGGAELAAAVPAELPEGALLLGDWDGRSRASFALPPRAAERGGGGRIVVHSLAHGRPVAAAALAAGGAGADG